VSTTDVAGMMTLGWAGSIRSGQGNAMQSAVHTIRRRG